MKPVTAYRIIDHGPENVQYFPGHVPGHGIALTSYKDCATGSGDTPAEALSDALDTLTISWVFTRAQIAEMNAVIARNGKASIQSEMPEGWEDAYWYVSIDVR